MRFSSKIRGVFKVTSSNLIALSISLLTSFVLPIFISVEEYGYWQLFVLYSGYVGFFILGFNDGVHINYASFDYDETLASKFHTFKTILVILSLIESVVLTILLFSFHKQRDVSFYILLFCIINILPQAIIGLFTYMNQNTLRFTQYSIGNVLDKIVFAVSMVLLLILKFQNAVYYIGAYTISRYIVIGYHRYSSIQVFKSKPQPIVQLKKEIFDNYKYGFPLMISYILHGTIIVGSRLLVKKEFGIETFSAYSFSLHTIVVAAQFIGAITTVFFPIMKRSKGDELKRMYKSFDKISTILSAVLLLSYFLVVILIKIVYAKYSVVLDYLLWVYPLFIFTCKGNLLITNYYKVRNQPVMLIILNAIAIVIHMLFALIAFWLFGTVNAIACSVLLSYALWYYLCQMYTYRKEKWKLKSSVFFDAILISLFVAIVLIVKRIIANDYYFCLTASLLFAVICACVYMINKKKIDTSIKEFLFVMKD